MLKQQKITYHNFSIFQYFNISILIMWLQTSIWSNRMKTLYLLILFPVFLFWVFFVIFWISFLKNPNSTVETLSTWVPTMTWECISNGLISCPGADPISQALSSTLSLFTLLGPVILVWCLISFLFYRQIVFKFSWATPISRKDYPQVYNIVENLCISRWILVDEDVKQWRWIKIWIIDDMSLNAFALWWNPKNSWIVFSRWILEKLNKQEIEAVAAHELTHILNKDSLLMITIVVFIWAIATIGEIVFRAWLHMSSWSSNSDSKNSWQIKMVVILVWVVLMILGYLIFPLVQLAVSRRREYLADAGSVELTKDKYAMISALKSISQDSVIENIKKWTVAAMCIESPFDKKNWWFASFIWNLFSTHPSIEDRISALEKY